MLRNGVTAEIAVITKDSKRLLQTVITGISVVIKDFCEVVRKPLCLIFPSHWSDCVLPEAARKDHGRQPAAGLFDR